MIKILKRDAIIGARKRAKRKETPQMKGIRKLKVNEGFFTVRAKEQSLRLFVKKEKVPGKFQFSRINGKLAVLRTH